MTTGLARRKRLKIVDLLRPHTKSLLLGILAAIGEGVANLLEPWPLKIVLDNVLKSKPLEGWLNQVTFFIDGTDKWAVLKFAAMAVLVIAVFGAICSYIHKRVVTTVGQWVSHDLRRTLYHHIQRLSLSYHDHKRTGDLITRVTGDIDSIQSFISQALLGLIVQALTLFGMIAVMFYLDWRFTVLALSVTPALFIVVYGFTR